jgi:hypothetical protein
MLRASTPEGWFLITHPEHARLAGEFASAWGNSRFRSPFPLTNTLEGIRRHDDGWATRDLAPKITREGRPSAFGIDLVGKYSAFEEIDLADYLQVRGRAMEAVAAQNAYAAVLISMHTCNLLTERADHSTLRPEDRPKLAAFLEMQERRQEDLSLLSCVDYPNPASLLHPLPLAGGGMQAVAVHRLAERTFRLDPWPLREAVVEVSVTGRRINGERFDSESDLATAYARATPETLLIRLESGS